MKRESWLPAVPESAPQARALVREIASELRLDGATTWELMLATTEAFANAVEHGAPCEGGGILLRIAGDAGGVGVEVADCGYYNGDARSSKPEGLGGRGIPIIAAIMDSLEVLPEAGSTRVRFEKRVAVAV
jgi:anti-sigma regulatory factor (Ser/Thr protein kinase)